VTVLIETRSSELADPPAVLTAELAWCLERFLTGRADDPTMRRAQQALKAWEAWAEGAIDLRTE
jgi:hypothetical protein